MIPSRVPCRGNQKQSHRCAAHGCKREIPRHMLMCGTHWRMLPRDVQQKVYEGWELWNRGGPSEGWVNAVDAAVHRVAVKEHYPNHGVCRVCRAEEKRQESLFI